MDRDSPFGFVFGNARVRLQCGQDNTQVVVLDQLFRYVGLLPGRTIPQLLEEFVLHDYLFLFYADRLV